MEAQRAAAIEKAVTAFDSDVSLLPCPSTGGSCCSKGDTEAGETTAGLRQLPARPSIPVLSKWRHQYPTSIPEPKSFKAKHNPNHRFVDRLCFRADASAISAPRM